jgi:hypothetical protein
MNNPNKITDLSGLFKHGTRNPEIDLDLLTEKGILINSFYCYV